MPSINKCPKCGYSSDIAFEECPKCGLIIEKFIEIQKRQEKQKRIEKLEKKLDELEKIDTPFKLNNLGEKKKPSLNFINITLSAFFLILILIFIAISFMPRDHKETSRDHKETSAGGWATISKCEVYYREMQRANYAYLHGGGTKAEIEEARRRWQECILRYK